jgi:D-alanine-D-alanine ligase-like ATP-grasp enzyme
MSGANVWLKLLKSNIYKPKPYLLDFENNVWELPYALILNHTVEEIIDNAKDAKKTEKTTNRIVEKIKGELLLNDNEATEKFFIPKKISFDDFIKKSKFVFLGLHGGDGENGNFQKILKGRGIKFNGSDEKTSRLCMDKFATGEFIRNAEIKGVQTAPQKVLALKDIKMNKIKELWMKLQSMLDAKTIIVKPTDDGCSTGVAHLYREIDLKNYLQYLIKREDSIPRGVLFNQESSIEMPKRIAKEILFEKFIRTDSVQCKANKLKYTRKDGWVEVTIGILEIDKKLHAFNPSLTIAEGEVLSLEEKFQGGTGINITPPPTEIVKTKIVLKTRELAEKLATKIGIKGYARIDAFMNVTTGALIVIEVNTLPALTPSTVLYHQALAENPPIFPLELIERIIKNKGY